MKKGKERIDELIKEVLSEEEAAFYTELEEKDIFGKLGDVYRSKLGWLAIIMTVVQVALFAMFIYSIIQFLAVEDAKELIQWSAIGFLCMMALVMTKLYVWMQMDKNDILREVKRLELQLAAHMGKYHP